MPPWNEILFRRMKLLQFEKSQRDRESVHPSRKENENNAPVQKKKKTWSTIYKRTGMTRTLSAHSESVANYKEDMPPSMGDIIWGEDQSGKVWSRVGKTESGCL